MKSQRTAPPRAPSPSLAAVQPVPPGKGPSVPVVPVEKPRRSAPATLKVTPPPGS